MMIRTKIFIRKLIVKICPKRVTIYEMYYGFESVYSWAEVFR